MGGRGWGGLEVYTSSAKYEKAGRFCGRYLGNYLRSIHVAVSDQLPGRFAKNSLSLLRKIDSWTGKEPSM